MVFFIRNNLKIIAGIAGLIFISILVLPFTAASLTMERNAKRLESTS